MTQTSMECMDLQAPESTDESTVIKYCWLPSALADTDENQTRVRQWLAKLRWQCVITGQCILNVTDACIVSRDGQIGVILAANQGAARRCGIDRIFTLGELRSFLVEQGVLGTTTGS